MADLFTCSIQKNFHLRHNLDMGDVAFNTMLTEKRSKTNGEYLSIWNQGFQKVPVAVTASLSIKILISWDSGYAVRA